MDFSALDGLQGLEFVRVLKKAQYGEVRLCRTREGVDVALKTPNAPGFVPYHEHRVMKALASLRNSSLSFMRSVGVYDDVPEEGGSVKPVGEGGAGVSGAAACGPVLVMDYIAGRSLRQTIRRARAEVTAAIMCHLFASLASAHAAVGLTHYDLHTNNVVVRKCNRDILFLLRVGADFILVPSQGRIPVVIDYGFSHVEGLDGEFCDYSLSHTNLGVRPDLCNPLFDIAHISSDALAFVGTETPEDRLLQRSLRATQQRAERESSYPSRRQAYERDGASRSVFRRILAQLREENLTSTLFDPDRGSDTVDVLKSLRKAPMRCQGPSVRSHPFVIALVCEWNLVEGRVRDEELSWRLFVRMIRTFKLHAHAFEADPPGTLACITELLDREFLSCGVCLQDTGVSIETLLCACITLSCCIERRIATDLRQQQSRDADGTAMARAVVQFHRDAPLGKVSLTQNSLVLVMDPRRGVPKAWNPSDELRRSIQGVSFQKASSILSRSLPFR